MDSNQSANQPVQDEKNLNQTPPAPPPTPPTPPPPKEPSAMPQTPPPTPNPTPPPANPPPPPEPSKETNNIPLQQPSEQNVGVGTPNIGVEEKQEPTPAQQATPNQDKEYTIDVADSNKNPANQPPPQPPDNTPALQIKNYQNPSQNIPAAPQPPVKASSNTSLVIFIILAIITGSAGGFLGFRYYDQTKTSASTETSPQITESPTLDVNTWSTYTSTLYNFSLKYPNGWATSTTDQKAEALVFASNPESLSDTPTGFKIEINFQNSNDQTLKKWVEANTVIIGEKKTAKEITVSGQTVYQQELTKNGLQVATYLERPSKIMIVTYSAPETLFGEGGDWYNTLINSITLT